MSDMILKLGFGAICFIFTAAFIYVISNFFRKQIGTGQEGATAEKRIQVSLAEQRRHPRADIAYPVKMMTPRGAIAAQTKNISLGGAFVCCQKPLPLGQHFSLTIAPPVHPSITVNAEVVWSNVNVPDDKVVNRGMGIKFLNITKKDREILDKIIATGMQREPA